MLNCSSSRLRPLWRPAVLSILLAGTAARAAEPAPSASRLPCPDAEVKHYTAPRLVRPPVIDGRLDDEAWRPVPESERYVDLIHGTPAIHDTRAKIAWDDTCLYLGIRVEEPFVRAHLTQTNDPIYQDNDVEVFIAGPDAYYEFEVNAFNTTYEVFFLWETEWEKAGFSKAPEFARDKMQPFNGVGFTTHPRGRRLGNFNWFFPGKKTAVFIDGTLNDDRDRDRGWSVELAFPWAGMKWLATDGRALPPKDGDVWRIDLSRFNQYKEAAPSKDSGGWALSAHRVWDSHIPECFPKVRFTTNTTATASGAGRR